MENGRPLMRGSLVEEGPAMIVDKVDKPHLIDTHVSSLMADNASARCWSSSHAWTVAEKEEC